MTAPKLTRSPGMTYLWMVLSLIFVVTLFARWDALSRQGRHWLWWVLLIAFLAFDFLFLLIPIRDKHSLRRLSAPGKLWAASAWLLVLVFLAIVVPEGNASVRQRHPIILASCGLMALVLLVYAIFRLSSSWVRESLRSIVARPGGGFLVRFQPDRQISTALVAIPGAHEEGSSTEWSVPPDPASAGALLQFAKTYDFDFVPRPRRMEKS